ncbi:MAG: hypothetical protein GF387_03225, partial [Candidatus Portnoybacteria bacterium]|nr:hypothetical protein [Candidatus Portnoybacteria bacterium]
MEEKNNVYKNKYKVLIPTSGLGQRLGEITKYTNKSLVRVGKKPVVSYIIESYPKDVELVITTGYFSGQVKEFIKMAYPERKISFVNVKKYRGQGSSLGYSMLQAQKQLRCPFILHVADTIVKDKISPPSHNWCGGFKGGGSASYSSFTVSSKKVQKINKKGALDFDFLHIGLVGIKDYKDFWDALEFLYNKNPKDGGLNDCMAINLMLERGSNFSVKEFKQWHDAGNIESLSQARKEIGDNFSNLDKTDESISIFKDFVIKFFYDSKIIKQRIERAKILNKVTPKIEKYGKNFYRYKYIEGDLYSETANTSNFKDFLSWAKYNLWPLEKKIDEEKFANECYKFYHDKTKKRINKFISLNSIN